MSLLPTPHMHTIMYNAPYINQSFVFTVLIHHIFKRQQKY